MRAPMLSADAESVLVAAWKGGDRAAYEYLLFSHVRMVAQYVRRNISAREDFGDIVQEAMIGLMRALDTFDPALGYRFSTFAAHHVRDRAHREWDRAASVIKKPVSSDARSYLTFHAKYADRIHAAADRDAERRKISREIGITLDTMDACDSWMVGGAGTSLSSPLASRSHAEGGDLTFGDTLVDPRDFAAEAEEAMEYDSKMGLIAEALRKLPDRTRSILESRFLVGAGEVDTLETLADRFGITRERVRQIEVRGLEQLKSILSVHIEGLQDAGTTSPH